MGEFQIKLIQLLADGAFHSGSEIGELLDVSRAAVWKQVQKLEELGLQVESLKGKGYRLGAPLDLLSQDKILRHAPRTQGLLSELVVEQQLTSTNDIVLRKADEGVAKGFVLLAESQTAGRGRRGKSWVSPFASNVYATLLWRFNGGAAALEGLSLVVGLAVAQALEKLGLQAISLKWPNDVLVDSKKICGVLIEMTGDAAGPCSAAIGVGVNVAMPDAAAQAIDQEWTDLTRSLKASNPEAKLDRNEITGVLLEHILLATERFAQEGLKPFVAEWTRFDHCADKPINLIIGNETVTGVGQGIDASGGIKLGLPNGQTKVYKGGEISLRVQAS